MGNTIFQEPRPIAQRPSRQNPEAFLQLLQQEAAGMDAEGLGDLEGLDLSPEGLAGMEGLEDEEMGGPDVRFAGPHHERPRKCARNCPNATKAPMNTRRRVLKTLESLKTL